MQRLLLPVLLASAFTLQIVGDASAATGFECGSAEHFDDARKRLAQMPPRKRAKPRRTLLGGIEKQVRDPFGEPFELRESENFAVKWTGSDVSEEKAAAVLASLEDSWTLYFDVLNMTLPVGTDEFKFNLYISGPTDVPPIDFAGGYATVDEQGFPYMVISEEVPLGDRLNHVVSHEFFHDVEFGAEAYFNHFWYWEASADWASQELYPNVPDPYGFIGAFALKPELPVFNFADPFGDPVVGVHQYGASIYLRFISEHVGDASTIAQSWETATNSDDPLLVLDRLLADVELLDRFIEFASRNTIWDYAAGSFIIAYINAYLGAFPEHSPLSATHDAAGTTGMTSVAADRLPRAMGYNVIEAIAPQSGRVRIAIEPEALGSAGTPARLEAAVVTIEDGAPVYRSLALTAGLSEHAVDVPSDQAYYLAVAAPSLSRSPTETYAYAYSIAEDEPEPEPDPEPEPGPEESGCGCSSSSGGGPFGAALLVLAVVATYRRRRSIR